VVDGHTFDSQAEASHYAYVLKPRLAAGEITHLQLQPVIRCEVNGKLVCKYLADFQYIDVNAKGPDGQMGATVIEDVKGYKTPTYRLKKKLVEALHKGTKIVEIMPNVRSKKRPSHARKYKLR